MAGGKKQVTGAARQRRSTTADTATLEDKCHPRKIFIGGLASDTTTQDLRDYFGQFGSIVDAVVLRWPDGRSRGFGYVIPERRRGWPASLESLPWRCRERDAPARSNDVFCPRDGARDSPGGGAGG
ncbi:unnamed protein product [Prorocentrum cordatum]|uniref:RRM domain-containing protein n=1 Tax=Prorocentrum cordatum TaxID=2364126 RepID=A0ABN9VRV5_9DINO|nr:unnamed protein product [Polarella glacialis]